MTEMQSRAGSSIVAVYTDHEEAEQMVRQLHEAGIPMSDLSIIGRGSQTTEEPVGLVSAGDYAQAGAATGAWFGGLLGLCVGAAFLVLPGIGPIVVAGPLSAAVLAGIEGALAGTALGSLAGAFVGWGVPHETALKYETHVKGGKYLVVVRGASDIIARAQKMFADQEFASYDLYDSLAD